MRIFPSLRKRMGRVIGTGIGALFLLGCGLIFTLLLAPRQKLEALRIERLPTLDAEDVGGVSPGEELMVTGYVRGDSLPEVDQFVAYEVEEWVVTPPDPATPDAEPEGEWVTDQEEIPPLALRIKGETVGLLAGENVRLSGSLHEKLILSENNQTATNEDGLLPGGSLRYKGLYDGDLVTVWGKKASNGDILPEEYFAGDRVAFEESKHSAAQGLLIGGICMLTLAPVVLTGGILSALFSRR